MHTVAGYDAPVLIKGETGTGKELVARAIHYSSPRRDQPFVPVNCGALNDELLLAELFGYERGAFTDAKRSHRGLVAQAKGGVLFLDEVDCLSPKGQAALLRFLQEQEYRPLGAETVYRSDVRVIAATNKNLETLIAQGQFREDLYYRVHLLDLELPPLRFRDHDVAVLAEHFLQKLSQRYGAPLKRLHPLTLQWMKQYAWPGNVRELENYLYRLFVLCKGPIICAPQVKGDPVPYASLQPPLQDEGTPRAFRDEKNRALQEFERSYLHKAMQAAYGNVSLAARRAGKERRAFRRLLKKHGIDRLRYDTPQHLEK
ncbi:MAG: sigma-54-dependent Fis family transcriptional regulator [Gammaproteobacteria bacterium]|nr:sigma-54-dependent Fis family transcriptional regulator [Gammaproteobacteria bacterium]